MESAWPAPASFGHASVDDSALHESPVEGIAWPAQSTCSAWVVVASDGSGKVIGAGRDSEWKEYGCFASGPVEDGTSDADCLGGAGEYGADDLRPLFRHAEMVFVSWIMLLLVASTGVNLWVGLRDVRSTLQLAGTVNLSPQQPLPPSMPPAGPVPARCADLPPNLHRERFSSLVVDFPTDSEHYRGNSVDKPASSSAGSSSSTVAATAAFYSGTTPDYCIVTVNATYTCLPDDKACTWSLQEGRRRCEAACSNTADSCAGVLNLPGHPLQERVCGLLGNATPSCSGMNSTAVGLRQLHAFYRLNLCMAPPTPPPPPQPPQPPVPASTAPQMDGMVDAPGATSAIGY